MKTVFIALSGSAAHLRLDKCLCGLDKTEPNIPI